MYTVKFERLIELAQVEWANKCSINQNGYYEDMYLVLAASVMGASPMKPTALLDEWYKAGEEIISRWDIRMVKKLVEIFPAIVPKKYRNGTFIADYDDNGDWSITVSG